MQGVLNVLIDGGPVVWVLLCLSAVSWVLIIAKALSLRGVTSGAARRQSALEAISGGRVSAAKSVLEGGRSPADRLGARALALLESGRPKAQIEADLEWRAGQEQGTLLRFIRPLELIATASPLLGLLGTVLGMIQAFRELSLAEGAANAALLADGIWQALLTTAAGLIVAIPALVAATVFSETAERATKNVEAALGQLLCDPAFDR